MRADRIGDMKYVDNCNEAAEAERLPHQDSAMSR